MIAQIAGWPDLRRRQELYASMSGTAARVVADIPLEHPTIVPWTATEMEAAYQGRFVTQEASDTARAEFSKSTQLPEESLLEWHSRNRDLFLRAYPGANINLDPGGQILRDRFTEGLDQAVVKEYTYDQRPTTYEHCLKYAQAKQATIMLMKGGKSARGVHAVGMSSDSEKNVPSSKGCYFCGSLEHFQRQCPTLDKARKLLDGGGRGGRGRGRGGRGRGAGRGGTSRGRGGPPRKGLNALGAEDQEEPEDGQRSSKNPDPGN
jgi:hypothetical protein